MPNIDGYEATKLIREEEHRYGIHTPIIALTAHNMEEDLQKAIDAGMDLHMTKPIERKRIVEAVCRVCKRENWWNMHFCIAWRAQQIGGFGGDDHIQASIWSLLIVLVT